MATFVVLPPRELLEHALREFLSRTLPGCPLHDDLPERLLNDLLISTPPGIYLIPREELPSESDVALTLCEAYGAEVGDRLVEIGAPRGLSASSLREQTLAAGSQIGSV